MFNIITIFSFNCCPPERSPDPNCDVVAACRKWHVCLCKSSHRIVLETLELSKSLDSKSKLVTVTCPLYLIERDSGRSTTHLG